MENSRIDVLEPTKGCKSGIELHGNARILLDVHWKSDHNVNCRNIKDIITRLGLS